MDQNNVGLCLVTVNAYLFLEDGSTVIPSTCLQHYGVLMKHTTYAWSYYAYKQWQLCVHKLR